MLAVNSVLLPVSDGFNDLIDEAHIIVYGDDSRDSVFLMNLSGDFKRPRKFSFKVIMEAIENNELEIATLTKPEIMCKPDSMISKEVIKKRDEIYNVILPLVSDLEEFFYPSYGSNLVAKVAKANNKTRYQVYQWVYKYLRYGQTKSAVTPNYTNTGSKERKAAKSKIGAPRKNSKGELGKNAEEEDKKYMLKMLKKSYWKENGMPLTKCLGELDRAYYVAGKTIDHNGKIEVHLKSKNERMSIHQFRYWETKLAKENGIDRKKKRHGKTRYEKDRKGRTGDKEIARGPGHIYEIDATQNDYESVSVFSKDRNQLVGRATIYFVRDQFSTAFTGLHVTLEHASFHTAKLALFNTFRDKVSYCKEMGVNIDKADWPQEGKPIKLVADNAELRSNLAESVTADSNVVIRFSREYRGDDKGLIEQAFQHYFASIKGKVDGYIHKRATERGTPDPKLKAILTIREFTQILIKYVIHYNNTQDVNPNQLDRAVVAAGIPLTPNNIWNWGLKYRPFARQVADEKELYLDLLEAGTATAKREGLLFKGCYYNSPELQASGLLDRALVKHVSKKVEIRFMRHNMNEILIILPNRKFFASLSVQSRRFNNCSLKEISDQLANEKDNAQQLEQVRDDSMASFSESVESMMKQAKREQKPILPKDLRNQSISDNREHDIEKEHQFEAQRFERFANSDNDHENIDSSSPRISEDENDSLEEPLESLPDKRQEQYSNMMNELFSKRKDL